MSDVQLRGSAPRFFERGLEGLHEGAAADTLPSSHPLPPASQPAAPALQGLLRADNLETWLHDWLSPTVADRSLLAPGAFQVALESALACLDGQVQAQALGPSTALRVLTQARDEVQGELTLRAQLLAYRHALLQG